MPSSSNLPAPLGALTLISYVVMLGGGFALLLGPQAAALLAIHAYNAAPVALLLAINTLVLGLAATAVRFKGGANWWGIYVVGTANVWVWLIIALDSALIWQIFAQERLDRAWLAGLLLPAIALAWVGGLLSGEPKPQIDREAVIEATLHPQPEPAVERVSPSWLQRLGKFALVVVRLSIIAICAVQLFMLAAGLVLAVYGVLLALLFNDQAVAPHRMGEVVGLIGEGLLEQYLALALPAARGTIKFVVTILLALAVIGVPLAIGLEQGMKWLGRKRAELPQASRDWIEASARAMMDWLATRPHKRLDSLVVTAVIILTFGLGWAMLAAPSWLLATWMNGAIFPVEGEIFRDNPGWFGVAAGSLAGFGVSLLLGMAGTQLLPGVKEHWASMNRMRMERQPGMMLQEALAALDSAASRGWYSMTAPFEPEAFLQRWLGRSVNAARTILLVSLPVILGLTVIDAFWFRSWGQAGLRHSGPFEISVHDRPYAEALRVETNCYVAETRKNGPQANASYVVVFDEDTRFDLRRRLNPAHLDSVQSIDQALRGAGVPVVESQERQEEGRGRSACHALLRGRFGEDAGRLQAILTGSGN